jgi:hypothetical protein
VLARLLPGDNARLRRGWAAVGAVLGAAALVWSVVWVQRSADTPRSEPPLSVALPPSSSPSWVAPASPLVSLAPSPRASPASTASSSPRATASPSRTPAPTRPAGVSGAGGPKKVSALTATYAVGSSWDTGFIGGVTLTNGESTAVTWTVIVRNGAADGVKITDAWNATLTRQGDTDSYTGGPLAAGATATFGFEATKQATGKVTPVACTVNESTCRVS